jgi:hypothetical protein
MLRHQRLTKSRTNNINKYSANRPPYTYTSFIHSFIHQWLYSPLLGPGLFFSFVIFFTQTVWFLGRVLSPSQGRYLHTGQHKHRINALTDIHALSGVRTHDPSVLASEDSSCLRPRGHRDRLIQYTTLHTSTWKYYHCPRKRHDTLKQKTDLSFVN